jgi:hypothetical protein
MIVIILLEIWKGLYTIVMMTEDIIRDMGMIVDMIPGIREEILGI